MKTLIKNRLLLAALFAGLGLFLTPGAQAQFQWANRVASVGNWPEGEPNIGLALDTNDNCYVAGFFDDTNNFGGITLTNQSVGGSDVFLAKYNSTGALQWAQRAGGTSSNYGRGVGVDTNGNIYVTGGYQGPAKFGGVNLAATSGEQFFLAKYNSAGTVQWVQSSTGGNGDNNGIGLAVDNAGNTYALAIMDYSGTSITFGTKTVTAVKGGTTFTILVKYDNTGAAQWAQLFDSSQESFATKLAVDAAGNVYVRGTFYSDMTIGGSSLTVSPGSMQNMFVAKFNNSGSLVWIQQPQGDVGEGGVTVDQSGNVYVSGYFDTNLVFGGGITLTNTANSSAPFGDAFVAKYNSAGAIQWAQPAGGANGGFYWDLALDAHTNIYAAGFLGYDAAIAKYNPAGTLQWTYSATGPPASPVSSGVVKCAVDSTGNSYLAGIYQGTATFSATTLQPQEAWNFFLTQVSPALAVTTTSLPNGTVGVAYSQTLTASGGQTPYAWTNISGGLPPGLALAANGVISGTPTTNGMFNFTVKITDALSTTATQALALTVLSLPSVVWIQPTNSSITVPAGGNVTFSVSVTGTGPFSYQWQLNGTNLPDGIITTVAGGGSGDLGDGGAATNASLYYPDSVAVDTTGNLFITDEFNYRIREMRINGTITTVAGNGTYGYSGDGGAATNAEFSSSIGGVAVDVIGNIYIADSYNSVIRKVNTNGFITTVAGNGTNGYSGDGGAATNAELALPQGVAVDTKGNLFIADTSNSDIRKVDINGIITTVAGGGSGGLGDGEAATNASLYFPVSVAVDTIGNLFIADSANNLIREVDTNGIINTVAGNGYGAPYSGGYSGDGGAATNASLNYPVSVAVDTIGNLFIADSVNNVIREVEINGIIDTVAGNGYDAGTYQGGYSGDGGAATNAELELPNSVAVDATGNLFIADSANNVIRKVTMPGPTLTLNDVGFGNGGTYVVVVSGPYGSVTSSVVNIIIPPFLSAPQVTGGNTNFTFMLSGPAGSNYVLQVSTNLLNWNSVSTSTIPVSGSISLSNTISGYNRRFYRVHLQ